MGLKTFWINIYQRLAKGRSVRRLNHKREADVIEEIERIVRETDLSLLPVHRFRKKMIPAVRHTMQYISQLISQVPGPVDLDPEHRNDDPLLRAMFLNSEELTGVLRSSETLRDFFQHTDAAHAFVLMIADRKEKVFWGTGKNGEIVRRDVPQKAVFFEDFKMLAPAADLAATQVQFQHYALVALFVQALDKITDLTSWQKELEHQRDLLKFKVKQHVVSDTQADLKPKAPPDNQTQEAMQVLSDINQKLAEIVTGLDTPEDRLTHLCEILRNPEQHLKLKTVSLKLSRLGIRLEPSSTELSNEFEVAEFELGQNRKQTAVWVRVKRASVYDKEL